MQPIVIDDLVIYYNERRVEVAGTPVVLTDGEWDILESLGLCAGSMVTRRMLLAVVHRYTGKQPSLRSVDAAVSKTRGKLARASDGRNYILPVWQDGYVLRAPEPKAAP